METEVEAIHRKTAAGSAKDTMSDVRKETDSTW